jgi:hypothetical protein
MRRGGYSSPDAFDRTRGSNCNAAEGGSGQTCCTRRYRQRGVSQRGIAQVLK